MNKKLMIGLIAAIVLLSSVCFAASSNRRYYYVDIVDEWGELVTSPAITQVDIQNESGTAVAVYSTKTGTTEVGSTGVITAGLSDGRTEFWYADTAIDITVTDATYTREIESFGIRDHRFMFPTFLTAMAGSDYGQTDDIDFSYASWIIDGDTTNRLDMIPDNDNVATLAIGDGDNQADVYIYSDSTSDYWLFDEGAGEVYYENLDLQFGDNDILYFGADNDASITYDETTDDNLEITAASVGMSITTNDFLITLDGVAADQFKVDATGTIDGDAVNVETTDGGIMLNADGSSFGDIELNSADDTIITVAGDMTATVTGTAFIDATADVKITSSKNAANAVLITEDGGTGGTIKVHADTGTAATANAASVQLTSDLGGVQLVATANVGVTEKASAIQLTALAGGIELYSGLDATNAIKLTADGGVSSDIDIFNDTGTSADSIHILTDLGGITATASAGTIVLTADGATAGDILIDAEDKITILSADADAQGIYIHANGGASETIQIHSDQGEAATSIYLKSDEGGITLLSDGSVYGDILIDCEDDMAITSGDDMTLTVAGDLTLAVTGSTVFPDDVLLKATVAVTAAEVNALAASPKELVAAVAGKMHEFVKVIVALDFGDTAWTESGDNLAVRYHDGSGIIVSDVIEAGGLATATEDTVCFAGPVPTTSGVVTEAASTNKALVLDNTGSEWGNDGNGALVVIIYYRTHTTAELGL